MSIFLCLLRRYIHQSMNCQYLKSMKTVNGNHLAELPKIVTLPKSQTAPQSEIQTQVKVAAEHLFKGEVIATPTDTIYGLAALANNTKAVTKIYDIKGRDFAKPVAICVAELEDVYKWGHLTIPEELLSQLLPGPVTLCLNRQPELNKRLNPDSNLIGIRIPDHPFIRGVCREVKLPLALTSANISNEKSALSIEEFSELYGHLSCVVDGGTLGLNDQARLGSTVVDLSHQGFYTIIRPGSAEKDTVAKLEKFGIIEKQQK